jgi:DNA-binding PadR family transcriptional regulator
LLRRAGSGTSTCMTVPYAILAVLREEPKHGYAIRSDIQEMLGLLWPVNQGQLYSTLARLATRGWIAACAADRDRAIGRAGLARRYEIRPTGRRRLEEWLARPTPPSTALGELHDKLQIAAALGDDARLARLVGRQREALVALAATYRLHGQATSDGSLEPTSASLPRNAATKLLEADVTWLSSIGSPLGGERPTPAADSIALRPGMPTSSRMGDES